MAAIVLVAALAGCGDRGPDNVEVGSTTTTTPAGFAAAGEPLRDGFLVPDGTRLVGEVFPNPVGETYDRPGWSALLEIERNPFEAWDAFARQARHAGYRFPGSSSACRWWPEGNNPDFGMPRPRTGPGSEPLAPGIAAPTDTPRAIFCDATSAARVPTTGVATGRSTTLTATLRWGHGDRGDGDAPGASVSAAHLYLTDEQSFEDSDDRAIAGESIGAFSNDPAPTSLHRHLPEVTPAHPRVGQPMGASNNCFETGYDRLVVPKGAEILGDAWAVESDFVVVAKVDDARAFFANISRQLLGPSDQPRENQPQITTVETTDGSPALTFSHAVDAGGGACNAQASADGRYVMYHSHSD